jgi:hypothetical protein
MNIVAAHLIVVVVDEEMAFWCLAQIVQRVVPGLKTIAIQTFKLCFTSILTQWILRAILLRVLCR